MRKLIYLFFVISITIIICEITLRCIGIKPIVIPIPKIQSKPVNAISFDSNIYYLNDGQYSINLNGLTYTTTHKNGRRYLSSLKDEYVKKTIDIYGCSFTYGEGLDDKYTFPYLLNEHYSFFNINNYGVSSYGILQSYLRFKNNIENGEFGDVMMYMYNDFHKDRNTITPLIKLIYSTIIDKTKKIVPKNSHKKFRYPSAEYKNGNVIIDYYQLSFFDRLVYEVSKKNSIVTALILSHTSKNKDEIAINILDRIRHLCEENKIKLIIAFMSTPDNDNVYNWCLNSNIPFVDISIDLTLSQNNLLPYDPHPSSIVNIEYFNKLKNFLDDYLKEFCFSTL